MKDKKRKGEGKKVKEVKNAYITFVLDESGSMSSVSEATIRGVNEQVQQLKKDFGSKNRETVKAIVSLIKFNGDVTPVFMYKDIDSLKEITAEDYKPNGNTAMYDAVGYAVNQLNMRSDINDSNTTSLVIVVSDGEENSSKEMNAQTLADTISKMNDTKRWTFTYLGANQDLSKVSTATNIYRGNTMAFAANTKGVSGVFASNATSLHNYAYILASGCTMTGQLFTGTSMNNFYSSVHQPDTVTVSGPVSNSVV